VIPLIGESWMDFWGSPREGGRNIPTLWTEWFEPGRVVEMRQRRVLVDPVLAVIASCFILLRSSQRRETQGTSRDLAVKSWFKRCFPSVRRMLDAKTLKGDHDRVPSLPA
jgi:hypothetical protein